VKVFPFRGVRYNPAEVGRLDDVVTQPYDKIDTSLQRTYYDRHACNFVRIIRGLDESDDNERENKYTRAAAFLESWLTDGILVLDEKPAIYAYHQEYNTPGGERLVRKGFVALGGLEDFSEGGVKPHERTLAGPKADRFKLMMQTGAQFGQIFMLYSDPEMRINRMLDHAIGGLDPLIEVVDDFGETHRLWAITDPKIARQIAEEMENRPVFIADGHHRYETSLEVRNKMREAGRRCEGAESFENRLMTFVNLDDRGLTVFPTHRLVYNVESESVLSLVERAGDLFDVQEFPIADNIQDALDTLLDRMRETGRSTNAIGLYLGGADRFVLLSLRDKQALNRATGGSGCEAWNSLDVNVLHVLLMDRLLGVTTADLENQTKVNYERHAVDAVGAVQSGKYQLCFLLNPTRVEQVRDVAAAGEKMPQKSTDFYPKLLSGLVMMKMNFID